MTHHAVLRTDSNGLTTLTLNRPDKLNSLNTDLFEALEEHLYDIEAAPDTVGCVVLRGAGRCFSAGHDLGSISEGESSEELQYQASVIELLSNLPQPVICAVHSHCYTGALELALGGDIILAAANAKFADTHAKWGLTPLWGMSQRLPRRVGVAKAHEMMFTCRTYSGAEAERMGLANACFDDAEFDRNVEQFAREILENSWFSNSANKRLLIDTDGMPLAAGLAHEFFRNEGKAPDLDERLAQFSNRGKA